MKQEHEVYKGVITFIAQKITDRSIFIFEEPFSRVRAKTIDSFQWRSSALLQFFDKLNAKNKTKITSKGISFTNSKQGLLRFAEFLGKRKSK